MPLGDLNAVLGGKRILVVEDEPFIALELEEMIVDLGGTLAGSFAQVGEALVVIQTGGVDAAILDVNLGTQRVDPVADALAALNCPFVFTTGYGRIGVPGAYSDRAVVEKPFTYDDIAAALIAEIARFGQPGPP
ncbi:MAG TPA: response regulator [Beijerinckiaceae bacterium]|nr:response regulator [Beijerinckiaceae bacterium]